MGRGGSGWSIIIVRNEKQESVFLDKNGKELGFTSYEYANKFLRNELKKRNEEPGIIRKAVGNIAQGASRLTGRKDNRHQLNRSQLDKITYDFFNFLSKVKISAFSIAALESKNESTRPILVLSYMISALENTSLDSIKKYGADISDFNF